jgi:hypothetical protein
VTWRQRPLDPAICAHASHPKKKWMGGQFETDEQTKIKLVSIQPWPTYSGSWITKRWPTMYRLTLKTARSANNTCRTWTYRAPIYCQYLDIDTYYSSDEIYFH